MRSFIPHVVYQKLPNVARRLEWADEQGRAMQELIKHWQQHSNFAIEPTISKDRLTCTWRIKLDTPPPLEKLGFMFSDAIHNTRSALDNAVYEKALSLDITEKLNLLEFPICETPKDWQNKSHKLAALPASLKVTIKNLQPFNLGQVVGVHLLRLASFNNIDKHRTPILAATAISHAQNELKADPFGDEPPHEWQWTFSVPSLSFENESPVFHLVSDRKLGKVSGEIQISSLITATDDKNRTDGLLQGFSKMLEQTVRVVEALAQDGPPENT